MRLNAGYIPPHWKPAGGDKWDKGYDTTAYFLDWIEQRCGRGTIRKLNAFLKDRKYDTKVFLAVAGDSVDVLWNTYCQDLKKHDGQKGQV